MEQKKADENVLRLVEEQKVVHLVLYYIIAYFFSALYSYFTSSVNVIFKFPEGERRGPEKDT